jgi:hypothetical protein
VAQIDLSELMTDPDFVDAIRIVRRAPTVNSYGENTLTSSNIDTYASVQSPNGETLNRLPDGAVLSDYKVFYCKTPLYADRVNGYADIIEFAGLRYQVINSIPWSNWGAGWYRADCVMEKLSA